MDTSKVKIGQTFKLRMRDRANYAGRDEQGNLVLKQGEEVVVMFDNNGDNSWFGCSADSDGLLARLLKAITPVVFCVSHESRELKTKKVKVHFSSMPESKYNVSGKLYDYESILFLDKRELVGDKLPHSIGDRYYSGSVGDLPKNILDRTYYADIQILRSGNTVRAMDHLRDMKLLSNVSDTYREYVLLNYVAASKSKACPDCGLPFGSKDIKLFSMIEPPPDGSGMQKDVHTALVNKILETYNKKEYIVFPTFYICKNNFRKAHVMAVKKELNALVFNQVYIVTV